VEAGPPVRADRFKLLTQGDDSGCGWGIERETDRQTDRQTDTQTEKL